MGILRLGMNHFLNPPFWVNDDFFYKYKRCASKNAIVLCNKKRWLA